MICFELCNLSNKTLTIHYLITIPVTPVRSDRQSLISSFTSQARKDKPLVKVSRSWETAPLSHLCFLIPLLFNPPSLLFFHLFLFLLSSPAEAVQATEAGTGEGHGLPVAPHSRRPVEGGWKGKKKSRGRHENTAL